MSHDGVKPGYRPCVGIMLLNHDGRVLVGQRIDMPSDHWQMPQGGIDPGEDVRTAAMRELKEEIGTNRAEVIAESEDWLSYDVPAEIRRRLWGGRYLGQMQKWLVMRFTGQDSDIDLDTHHPEFRAWKWVDIDSLPDLIVPFKRDLYIQLVARYRNLARKAH
jgi:putative (di)nucleoside polyphosphate hydrolase